MIYLDNNATTRPHPDVVRAMVEMLEDHWHNPSSVHRAGQAARHRVELARRSIADLIGVKPRSITFTSGGTESIDLAIRGSLRASGKRVLVTSPVEHAAVRDLAASLEQEEGVEVRYAAVDRAGRVLLDSLERLIDEHAGLVSIQWANNETGVIQPLHDVARLAISRGVWFHCDATQWVGKMPTRLAPEPPAQHPVSPISPLFADLLTFAPHKFHGPKGVGVLYVRPGARLAPRIRGAQELGRRGGTENVPGIVGAGVAADLAAAWLQDHDARTLLAGLRDRFETGVLNRIPDAVVNGAQAPSDPGPFRLWNTTNIGFPALEAEALLLLLSEQGLCASAGAACSSGSLDPSPVLLAMGIPPRVAHGSLRFSLSRETTAADVDHAIAIVADAVSRLRSSMTTPN
ncbi:MAG: cysteine desulfurase family protein [Phycisphaerales bacterium]